MRRNNLLGLLLEKGTRKYPTQQIVQTGLKAEDEQLLFEIGLPNVNKYYSLFYPLEDLELIGLQDGKYVAIGNPFKDRPFEDYTDNFFALNLNDGAIYFYSESFFEINYYSKPILIVNKNLESFLLYIGELIKLTEKIFTNHPSVKSFNMVKLEYRDMVRRMISYDPFALGPLEGEIKYWRKVLYRLDIDIVEKYNSSSSIRIDDLI